MFEMNLFIAGPVARDPDFFGAFGRIRKEPADPLLMEL
jgi:hypothetical protein